MAATRYIPIALTALLAAGAASAQTGAAKAPKQTKAAPAKAGSAKAAAPKVAPAANPANARYNRSAQIKPTVDRYLEIQKALHDRGYLAGPVDGKWSADSVEALKRFQQDQNLEGDGKLGALSLVALGLGPKRTATVSQAAAGSPTPPQVE